MPTIKKINYSIINKDKSIDSAIFYLDINDDQNKQMYLIHRALKQQLTNYRTRNAHTKTRSEVRGGGKKPWKQKGTGRARAGSTRSPLWKGGGVIFGPRRKKYKSKLNKKEKKLAINTVLYNKFGNTIVTNEILIQPDKPSTKQAIAEISRLGIDVKDQKKILLIIDKKTNLLHLSFRNLNNVQLIEVKSINILSLLKADIILVTKSALDKINRENN
uniref:Large ribosomal subunit protein uL4c n=1 Tax=Rhodomela confervoides TaxID=35163 RepID=A0A1Z1MA78_RHOCN|nr:ribosomal protein L4 [Rhodomela confervoides]ARW62731.1 ribosomal protein L4 [Rhodomela confervoides]